jgi:hypothetical protein
MAFVLSATPSGAALLDQSAIGYANLPNSLAVVFGTRLGRLVQQATSERMKKKGSEQSTECIGH